MQLNLLETITNVLASFNKTLPDLKTPICQINGTQSIFEITARSAWFLGVIRLVCKQNVPKN